MKEAAVPAKNKRRQFDPNFKHEAAALWKNSGKPAQEIAQQLGVREGQLYEWKKRAIPIVAQDGLQAEVIALRKENTLLRQQRDILENTLGIMPEPLKSASNGSTR